MTTKTIGTIPPEKLLGMEIDLLTKLRSGALSIHNFETFLKGQNPFAFPRRLKLGTFETVHQLHLAMEGAKCWVSDDAGYIMAKSEFAIADTEDEVELIIVSGVDLGFTEAVTLKEIYTRATSQEYGYMLCPPEVGPQLRLQYLGQPKNEWLLVGMDPIVLSDDGLHTFGVAHDRDGLWLRGGSGDPDGYYYPGDRWVFMCPQQAFGQNGVIRFTAAEAKAKIGKTVRTRTEFAGVPMNTIGEVTDIYEVVRNEFDVIVWWDNGSKRNQDRFAKNGYDKHLIEL